VTRGEKKGREGKGKKNKGGVLRPCLSYFFFFLWRLLFDFSCKKPSLRNEVQKQGEEKRRRERERGKKKEKTPCLFLAASN